MGGKNSYKETSVPWVKINRNFQHKIVNIFLPIIVSLCYRCSKEPSHRDGSFENPQHMFWLRNKKVVFLLRTLNYRPVYEHKFLLMNHAMRFPTMLHFDKPLQSPFKFRNSECWSVSS